MIASLSAEEPYRPISCTRTVPGLNPLQAAAVHATGKTLYPHCGIDRSYGGDLKIARPFCKHMNFFVLRKNISLCYSPYKY